MILKRPYAFFIKFFKLFHLFLFLLSSILLYRTSLIYDFMKEYCRISPNVVGKDLVGPLFPTSLFVLLFFIFVFNLVIINILVRKSKPFMYYIVNMILYISVIVVYLLSRNVITDMQAVLLPMKTTLAIRDFLNLCRLFQTASVVFYLIRATGFDLKKFDFGSDLQSLNISEEDSEEYEVALDFEGNVFRRNVKKTLRNLKYYYYENKFFIICVSVVIFCLTLVFFYSSFNKYDKKYFENDFFNVTSYKMGVKASYITDKDFLGNSIISDDSSLVVVKLSVKGSSSTFPDVRAVLAIDGVQYYHNKSLSSLYDLGTIYNEQLISNDFSDYLFVYKIPRDKVKSAMQFRYIDNIKYEKGSTIVDSIDVNLKPVLLDNIEQKNNNYELGQEIEFSNYRVNISSFDLKHLFSLKYNSCVSNNECYDFNEVLTSGYTTNTDKILLKLEGSAVTVSDNKIFDLFNLFKQYGTIEYSIGENNYVESLDFSLVSPVNVKLDNTYYIEVNKDISKADKIKLVFNTREVKYSYALRGDINE